ncbi:MAG: DUF177 domain-containing protein [Rhizomicrobium sp.]
MPTETPPFVHDFNLADLNRGGAELSLAAQGDELAHIARWADVGVVESFVAKVDLRKHSANRFALDAELTAEIVQDCVVTLEPVRSRIERHVHRELHLTQAVRHRPGESIPLGAGAGDDEVPEEIDSLHYDLAAPLLEEFALAIDPYPRAPGVEFAVPEEPGEKEAAPENPFAVLRALKNRS